MFYSYNNGNYNVLIDPDTGTKIRRNNLDSLIPSFAENCDVTITTVCDNGCAFCYLNCSPSGKHADLSVYNKLIDSLHPYTELAINGNDLSHPALVPLLYRLKKKHVFANLTVNQNHFMKHHHFLLDLYKRKLIHGIGISYTRPDTAFIDLLKNFPTAVIHTINGVTTPADYEFLSKNGKNLAVLILGYKTLGKGTLFKDTYSDNIAANQKWLSDNVIELIDKIRTVSFDNLAIEQLNLRDKIDADIFDRYYMGDDGKYTFYIDLVHGYFASDSVSPIHYPINNMAIDEMFDIIQKNRKRIPA